MKRPKSTRISSEQDAFRESGHCSLFYSFRPFLRISPTDCGPALSKVVLHCTVVMTYYPRF